MDLSANSDVECYHCGQKGHKKKTVLNYKINLGTIKVMERARARARARETRNSRATVIIVENLAIKRLIVGRNTRRRNQLNIGRMMQTAPMWTFWLQILKGWKSWTLRNNYSWAMVSWEKKVI